MEKLGLHLQVDVAGCDAVGQGIGSSSAVWGGGDRAFSGDVVTVVAMVVLFLLAEKH